MIAIIIWEKFLKLEVALPQRSVDLIAQHDALMRQYAAISPHRPTPVSAQLERIWLSAIESAMEPGLSVQLGEIFRPQVSPFTSILMWSTTVRESLSSMTRFWVQHGTGGRFSTLSLEPQAEGTALVYRVMQGEPMIPYDAEFRLCRIITFLRQISDPALSPALVHFEHSAPPYAQELSRVFRAPVNFGQPATSLVFDPATLSLPVVATPAQRERLRQFGESMLTETGGTDGFAGIVREAIHVQLAAGTVGMRHVAPKLGISSRTLQRRLQMHDTTFQALLDEVRKAECLAIMREPSVSNREIAERLGYSNVANFHRAFRRWFQKTPNQMRRTLETQGPGNGAGSTP